MVTYVRYPLSSRISFILWVFSAYWFMMIVWKVMMSPSLSVDGSTFLMMIRSPASNVGDIDSVCTDSGVYPSRLLTLFTSLVASVVNVKSAASSITAHRITLASTVATFFTTSMMICPFRYFFPASVRGYVNG